MRTVFRLSSHNLIFNGFSKAFDKEDNISTSPPFAKGATHSAIQTTGTIPITDKIRTVFLSLPRIIYALFNYLELFLRRVTDLYNQIVHRVGGDAVLYQLRFQRIQRTNDDTMLVIVEVEMIMRLFHRKHLRLSLTVFCALLLLTIKLIGNAGSDLAQSGTHL